MEIIYTAESFHLHEEKIRKFKQLYYDAFPDDNEREDFDIISKRIQEKTFQEDSKTFLILDGISGLIAEYYPSCRCLLYTYIVVNDSDRGKGIARKMMTNQGLNGILKIIKSETGHDILAIFFESNNPSMTHYDSFDSVERLLIFKRLGAKFIDIPYVQPSLGTGKSKVNNLLLFTLPIDNHDIVETEIIISFLRSFYKELGIFNPDEDDDFLKMKRSLIGKYFPLSEIPTNEKNEFCFSKVSIAIHIPINKKFKVNGDCRKYSSFETDLFSYQYQKKGAKPFRNYCLNANNPTLVDVIFPEKILFQSEGRIETLLRNTDENERTVSIKIYVSLSSFDKHSVLSIIIQPVSTFTEYDIIKISTLFGSKQENCNPELLFRKQGEKPVKISDFINNEVRLQILKNKEHIIYDDVNFEMLFSETNKITTGTINLYFDSKFNTEKDKSIKEFFNLIHGVQHKTEKNTMYLSEVYKKFARLSNVLCGIALGIFDFKRMEYDEFSDTLSPILSDKESFIVMNRGILLQAYTGEETKSTFNTIGSDPYLIIPSVLLASREFILNKAIDILQKTLSGKPGINTLRRIIEEVKLVAQNTNSGLFQYKNEKTIYQKGIEERRLDDLTQILEDNILTAKRKLEFLKYRQTTIGSNLIALFLIILSIVQLDSILNSLITTYSPKCVIVQPEMLKIGIMSTLILIAIIAYILKTRIELKK